MAFTSSYTDRLIQQSQFFYGTPLIQPDLSGSFSGSFQGDGTNLTGVTVAGTLLASNNLSDVANAGTARTNLGVAIGSNVQAFSETLTSLDEGASQTIAGNKTFSSAITASADISLPNSGQYINFINNAAIYGRSGGSYPGLQIASGNGASNRIWLLDQVNTSGPVTMSFVGLGRITNVQTLEPHQNHPLILRGGPAPNDGNDGVRIQSADASNVYIDRFQIESDSTNVDAYFHNINGLGINKTSGFVAELDVSGDINASGDITGSKFKGDGSDLTGVGTVDTTGTPANNQVAVFTDSNTLEGDSNLTFDGSNLKITGSLNISGSTTIELPTGTAFEVLEGDKDQKSRFIFDYSNGDPTFTVASRASTAKIHIRQDTTNNGLYLDEDGNIYVNNTTSDGVKINGTCFAPIGTNANAFDLGSNTRPFKDLYLQLGGDIVYTTSDENMRLQHVNPNQLRISGSDGVAPSFNVLEGSITASYFKGDGSALTNLPASNPFPFTGSANISGSSEIIGSGSGIFSVEGSVGTLFSVDDGLDDVIFAANNISGTPVISANADNTVKLGKLGGFGIVISGSTPAPNDSQAKIIVTGSMHTSGSLGVGMNASSTIGRIDAKNDVVAFSTSDERLKDNIVPIEDALNKVSQVQGIEFDWIPKEGVHGNEGRDVGVIAQEIEKVLPEVVTTRDNGYKAVKYEKIIPLLVEAIKELQEEVKELKKDK